MLTFDHVGLVTDQTQKGEDYVAAAKVWVTNPNDHPYHIEWLRYEPDSPVAGPLRTQPHVAFAVKSLAEAAKGLKEIMAPFDVGFATVAFYQHGDGSLVEFMQYKQGAEWRPE